MKRVIGALLLMGISGVALAKESRIGVGAAWDYGFGVTAQIDGKINATLGNDGFGVDYLLRQQKIKADGLDLSWYIAAGAGMRDLFDDNDYTIVSGRGMAGLDLNLNRDFDLYLSAGPELRLYTGEYSGSTLRFAVDAAFGVRYFF